ncbi:3-dehydroquinate synthase [Brevibacillus massiliensis]|jgi:3-dehydroquinate synthase|uniref:3-dehydroquinate synthase n=1 Tax=Brevibacillus massiliensis TaxID=1118054 RepID=UPI00031E0158|nr:3-dehydroquinate synthase [Brevibacillus massiliensis]
MEPRKLTVELGERSYPILIGEGLLQQISALLAERGVSSSSKLLVVTDTNVAKHYVQPLCDQLAAGGYKAVQAVVEAGEQAKRLAVYEQVMTTAIEAGLDRKSVVIALGGGVIGDLAGFVAATFMRGIPFVQVPTTLLAHDSSVGGKVAVNHPLGKNMIGAFHQPLMVVYDTGTLSTLPRREIAAGFAEIIKHGLIADEAFVEWLERNAEPLNRLAPDLLAQAIERGCAIKASVVAADETEQGMRACLNLGHTFGHAFESLSAYSGLNHGEAISIGMVLAARLAERMGMAGQGVADQTKRVLELYGLPTKWPAGIDPEEVLTAMGRDKKGVGGQLVLVLPQAIGKVEIVRNVDPDLVLQVMKAAMEE